MNRLLSRVYEWKDHIETMWCDYRFWVVLFIAKPPLWNELREFVGTDTQSKMLSSWQSIRAADRIALHILPWVVILSQYLTFLISPILPHTFDMPRYVVLSILLTFWFGEVIVRSTSIKELIFLLFASACLASFISD